MRRAIPGVLLCLCAALPASGADLELSAAGEVEYDDNVFRRAQDEEDDVLFRLRPGLRVFEDRGDDVNYSLGYEMPVELSVDHSSDLNDVDHFVNGRANYHGSDRLEIFGTERFGYLRSTFFESRNAADPDTGAFVPDVSTERDRVTLNEAQIGASYQFDPRIMGRLIANSSYFDSTRDDRSRVWSAGATGDVSYRYSLNHQFGGGLGYTRQDFDDRADFAGSQTDIYRVFGLWRWFIDETMDLEVAAGPSYLATDQNDADSVIVSAAVPFFVLPAGQLNGSFLDAQGNAVNNPAVSNGSLLVPQVTDCAVINGVPVSAGCQIGAGSVVLDAVTNQAVVNAIRGSSVPLINSDPGGDDDSTVTIFANVTLSKRWTPTLASALRYNREQGNASGLGGTVITDAVSLSNTWDFMERWQLAVRGDWTRRESAFDSERTFNQVIGITPQDLNLPGGSFSVPIAGLCNPNLPVPRCISGVSFNAKQANEIDTDRWGVAVRITHRLFRTTSVYVQLRYDEQESQSATLGNASDFENFLATFGVRHVFEPIKLW